MKHGMKKHTRKDGTSFWTTLCGLHVDPKFEEIEEFDCKLCLKEGKGVAKTGTKTSSSAWADN